MRRLAMVLAAALAALLPPALLAQGYPSKPLHMIVAFTVIYCATGSLASGGIAAILEPV